MKLYTRGGDDGTTGLLGGARVRKDSLRVCAYGEVDELNAVLGWCILELGTELSSRVAGIQAALFEIGSELAAPAANRGAGSAVLIHESAVRQLESWIDEASESTPPIRQFILPGGGECGARLHMARGVCRRAERAVVHLMASEDVRTVIIHYLNRLGDLLFAWARYSNHAGGHLETPWKPAGPHHA